MYRAFFFFFFYQILYKKVSKSNASSCIGIYKRNKYRYITLSVASSYFVFRARCFRPPPRSTRLFNSNQTRNDILRVRSRGTFFHTYTHTPHPRRPIWPWCSPEANIVSSFRLYATRRLDTVSRGIPARSSDNPRGDFSQCYTASTSCIYHSNKLNAFSEGRYYVMPLVRLLFFSPLFIILQSPKSRGQLQ